MSSSLKLPYRFVLANDSLEGNPGLQLPGGQKVRSVSQRLKLTSPSL